MNPLKKALSAVSWPQRLLGLWFLIIAWHLLQSPDSLTDLLRADRESFNSTQKTSWTKDTQLGLRLAAWLQVLLLPFFLVTAPKWQPRPALKNPTKPAPAPNARWIWIAVAAIALGLGMRLPLASKSLWWDEAWALRQCSHGSWTTEENDASTPRFTPTTWKRCAYYYQKPTNHAPVSLAQKASLTLWRKLTGAEPSAFSDLAARLPALLGSAVSIFLMAALLRGWSASTAAISIGAFLMALHPLAIRYGVDTRGYALVLPSVLGMLLCGQRLSQSAGTGSWNWLAWGALSVLWLWAFPNAVLDLITMNLVLAALLCRKQGSWCLNWHALRTWLATNGLAALIFIQLFLPNLLQARRWMNRESQGHELTLRIFKDALSKWLLGISWPSNAALVANLSVLLVLTLALIGFRHLRRLQASGWLLTGLFISCALFITLSWSLKVFFYARFVIILVPIIILGIALAWDAFGKLGKCLHATLIIALISLGYNQTLPTLLTRPIEPLRDVADWLSENTSGPVIGYGHGREALAVYYPSLIQAADPAELEDHLQKARQSFTPIHLVVGHEPLNRLLIPTGFRILDDPNQFQNQAKFHGLEPELNYRILRSVKP